MAWISFGALSCRKKYPWWQLASRWCWNRAPPWHASELVSFLVRLRTYQHPGIFTVCTGKSMFRRCLLLTSSRPVKSKILLFAVSTGRERKITRWPLNNGNSKPLKSSGVHLRSLSSQALSYLVICLERLLVLKHFYSTAEGSILSNVYWTVHHCNSWWMKDQLDVTCYFISLLMCSTCFGH